MDAINRFLMRNGLRLSTNPCISPDFCLNWDALEIKVRRAGENGLRRYPKSTFETAEGTWTLFEDPMNGDCGWEVIESTTRPSSAPREGFAVPGAIYHPATWENLLGIKNQVQEHDPESTIFPTAGGSLGKGALGIGARFTTLHWPAVEWTMSALELGLTANQNSIPRELVYDVGAMLENRLAAVPFPFIGTSVPEGHQGQSVEGMSHGCILSKLKTGFHRRRIAWSFNADHQPIGGAFDAREAALVAGCVLASYITFDLSPELALQQPAEAGAIDPAVTTRVRARVAAAGVVLEDDALDQLLATVWPAMEKMKRRDDCYRAARERLFTCETGRAYLRELSIDELPGITAPETTAVMLALCEVLRMPVNFIAPAFGFQKNMPYADNDALRSLIERQWAVASQFGVSLGFHSGSGKSAGNYRVMGEVTGGRLEIKTSGRYTYEMGVALAASTHAADQRLWKDWYAFTLELALAGAFSADPTESRMARSFIAAARARAGHAEEPFADPGACRAGLEALPPSPDAMFFFEYNFLYVLAAGGRPDKAALGDHTKAGYTQRARFYSISPEARLLYAKGVAAYIIFLAEHTGLAAPERCAAARALLGRIASHDELVNEISR